MADVNGDGLDDIYICQPGGLPNRLYLQRTDGTLQDMTESAGVGWLIHTHGCLLVDLDNDGDQDVWLTNRTAPRVRFLKNNCQGRNSFLSLRLQGVERGLRTRKGVRTRKGITSPFSP